MRDQTTYREVIGTDEGTVIVLDYTFNHGDGFKGATGAAVRPVSQDEIDRALTDDEKQEWFEELWRQDAGTTNGTTDSLEDWAQAQDDDEYLDGRFESYQGIDAEDIAQAVGQEVPERYELIGCGRMFPQAIDSETFVPLDTDRARELIQIIRDTES